MPDITALPAPLLSERMLPPGANRSRHVPTLEKSDTQSSLSLLPTVMAAEAEAGL